MEAEAELIMRSEATAYSCVFDNIEEKIIIASLVVSYATFLYLTYK